MLAEAAETAGFKLAERAGADDATLLVLGSNSRSRDTVDSEVQGANGGAVAVVIDRAPRRRGRVGAVRRAVARLISAPVALPTALERRRFEQRLARPGTRLESVSMSDRARSTYQLGGSLWRRGLAPVGAIVWTIPDGRQTFVEAAVAEASVALGRTVSIRDMTVLLSGKILVELGDDGAGRWFLRIAGGPPAEYMLNSLHALKAIAEADAPAVLRERLVQPIAEGRIGPARYSLEEKVTGHHPPRLTSALWGDCLEFLVELHLLGPEQGRGELSQAIRRVESDLELLGRALGGTEGRAVEELAGWMAAELGGLPLGWEHGDFWAHNMIVTNGRLRAVLDWDTALAASLPLLDLFDLISLPPGQRRPAQVGPRLEHVLLPMVRRGGDERIRMYCDATGTPTDPDVLEGVAVAYWVSRAARAARDDPVLATRDYWVNENVRRPLRLLRRH